MKLYKICNKISLLLHALCSAAGYFLIEAISRHSFTDAWTYMTGKPLVFAYNAGLIFTTSLIVYLFRRRTFWRVLVSIFWLLLGIINGVILANRVTPFTGPDLHLLTDGMAVLNKYLPSWGVVVALIVILAIYLMLKYTRFGRSIYAVGGNQQSATLMGLDVKKTQMKAYILSSFLTSIGGICYCLNTMAGTTTQATGLEMDAISSAVIGGTLLTGGVGNVLGSLFGVLINGTISTLVKTNGKLISSWSNIVTAILLCFFIVLQSVFALVKERKSK